MTISKKQATVAAEALMHGRTKQLERRDPRLSWYPELQRIPLPERTEALKDARRGAWRSWIAVVLVCTYLALFVAWVLTRKAGLAEYDDLGAASILALTVSTMIHQWRVRRELRMSDWYRRASG